jgi:hypothetical protein
MAVFDREGTDKTNGLEGQIRDVVRSDVAQLGRAPEAESKVVANNIGMLLQRVAGSSVQEIDRLIGELERLREKLLTESARVQQEITDYACLSQSAMQSIKVISESISKWKHEGSTRG